jgi:hypothetical protein
MNPPILSPELQRLRRRFVGLMILQGCLVGAAAAFALAYFLAHVGWALPAFAAALVVAIVAQVRFIWMFKNSRG